MPRASVTIQAARPTNADQDRIIFWASRFGATQDVAMITGTNSKTSNVKCHGATLHKMRLWDRREMAMHTRLVVATSFLVLAVMAGASPTWAKWGCAARSPAQYWSNSYNDNNKAEAGTEALKGCHAAGGKGCHMIGCSANINTAEEANAMWPPPNPVTGVLLPAHRGTPKGRNP